MKTSAKHIGLAFGP